MVLRSRPAWSGRGLSAGVISGGRLGGVLYLVLLGACSPTPEQPGAVTRDEAAQLNDAATMLDANSMRTDGLPPIGNSTVDGTTPSPSSSQSDQPQ